LLSDRNAKISEETFLLLKDAANNFILGRENNIKIDLSTAYMNEHYTQEFFEYIFALYNADPSMFNASRMGFAVLDSSFFSKSADKEKQGLDADEKSESKK